MRLNEVTGKQVWYHGTDADFDQFDDAAMKSWKFGHWFTDSKDFAEMFGSKISTHHLATSRPKVITKSQWDDIRDEHAKDPAWFQDWRKKLIAAGHDGLMVKGGTDRLGNSTVTNPNIMAVFNVNDISRAENPDEVSEDGERNFKNPMKTQDVSWELGYIDDLESEFITAVTGGKRLTGSEIAALYADLRELGTVRDVKVSSLIPIESELYGDHFDDLVNGIETKTSSKFPVVWEVDDKMIINDGNHRVAAAFKRGEKTIKALVISTDVVEDFIKKVKAA